MMNKNWEKRSFSIIDWLTYLTSMFFIAYYFLRLFGFFIDSITFVIPLVIAICYMIFTINWNDKELSVIGIFLLLILILTLIEIICTNDINIKAFISMFNFIFMSFFPLYLVFIIIKSKNISLLKLILYSSFLVIVYVLIVTFIQLRNDDRFMRNMNINYTNYKEYTITNAGGYQFAYAMSIFSCVLSSVFFFNKRIVKFHKLSMLVLLLSTILLVLNSSYTLALLIAFLVIVFSGICNIKSLSSQMFFAIVVTIAIWLIFVFSDMIIDILPTEEMKTRVGEVFVFFKEGDASGHNLSGRLNLYYRAILKFFESPILGNETLDFDPHSSFLRFFARDGIIGGSLYLLLYFIAYKIVVGSYIGMENRKYFVPAFISLIAMGFVNPIHSVGSVHYILFFITPLLVVFFRYKEKDIYEACMEDRC